MYMISVIRLAARSWGASTPMKMCMQPGLDTTGALRHVNKNNSERPVCSVRTSSPGPLFLSGAKVLFSWPSPPGREGRAHDSPMLRAPQNDTADCRAGRGSDWFIWTYTLVVSTTVESHKLAGEQELSECSVTLVLHRGCTNHTLSNPLPRSKEHI